MGDDEWTNLVASLQEELASFKTRVKESPQEFKIISKPGYTGGGSLGAVELALLAGMGTIFLYGRKPQRK